MKIRFLVACAVLCFLTATRLHAQCDFTPVITPDYLALCPKSSDTLFTTETYDSYQWLKNNVPIEGATLHYLVVKNPGDVLKRFSVLATRNGCSALSKKVLVDGLLFLPPYTISTGDEGVYDPKYDALTNCPGDVHILTTSPGYETNVQWYDGIKPIRGANSPTLNLTAGKGNYTYSAAPNDCPDYLQYQPIPFNIAFQKQVSISERNDTLFASQTHGAFRWQWNGNAIAGAKENYLVPLRNGKYRVGVQDKYCTTVSAPHVYEAAAPGSNNISRHITFAPNPVHDILKVQVKSVEVSRIIISDLRGNRVADVPAVQTGQNIPVQQLHTGSYLLQVLNRKQQIIGSAQLFKQ